VLKFVLIYTDLILLLCLYFSLHKGDRMSVDNLLVALRHPGDPLIHELMETGNYTYLDVIVFLEIYSRTRKFCFVFDA